MAKKQGVWVKCDYCGEQTYKTPYQYKIHKNHFCSKECEGEFKHIRNSEARQCEHCGKTFIVRKSVPQRFCSVECQWEWQKTRIGELNPRFTSVLHKCDYCGKEHYVKPYKLNEFDHLFCSTACRQNWYAEVWSQQPEWREESAKRAVGILSSGRISRTNSGAQSTMNKMLDDLGIEYVNEYSVGTYSIDNFLPDHKKYIEVMGDYWHTNPVVYESPVYDMQQDRIVRDAKKHDFIVDETGVEPLYIWENDLNNRLDVCRALVEAYISEPLVNYHSFNYELSNNVLTPKGRFIIPFQEINMFTESVTTAGGAR